MAPVTMELHRTIAALVAWLAVMVAAEPREVSMSRDFKSLLLSVACLLFTVSSSDASALPITALRSQLALQAWAVESGGAVEIQIDADPPSGPDPGYAFGFPPPQSGTLDSLNVDVYARRGQVSAGAKGNAE
jgi:hypothetical protein